MYKMIDSKLDAVASVKQMTLNTISHQSEADFDLTMFEDDWLIERFLSAKKFDPQTTHDMLIKASKWRREHNVSTYTKDDCLGEIVTGKCRFYGVDRMGRPVCYIFPKLHFYNKANPHEFEKFLVWTMEYNSSLLRKDRLQGFVVIDLKGASMTNLDVSHLSFIVTILQDYYPELLGNVLILNLPVILRGPWGVLKKFLDTRVASKIIFGKKKDLSTYIEPSQILPDTQWAQPIDID
jgi:hypothetical protein